MPEEDKEKGNIKEKWIWFKKLNSVFERMYVGGKSGWVERGVHEGLMGQCHCDPLGNLNGSLVPISLHLIFLTQLCVPESTSAFFFLIHFLQFFTGGAPNMQAAKTGHYSGWCVGWQPPILSFPLFLFLRPQRHHKSPSALVEIDLLMNQ